MLNLREADLTQTRFYQQILQIGEKQGEKKGEIKGQIKGQIKGEINIITRLLKRRFGNLTPLQIDKIKALSLVQLESLGEALLDFQNLADLETWLLENEQS